MAPQCSKDRFSLDSEDGQDKYILKRQSKPAIAIAIELET